MISKLNYSAQNVFHVNFLGVNNYQFKICMIKEPLFIKVCSSECSSSETFFFINPKDSRHNSHYFLSLPCVDPLPCGLVAYDLACLMPRQLWLYCFQIHFTENITMQYAIDIFVLVV